MKTVNQVVPRQLTESGYATGDSTELEITLGNRTCSDNF